MNKKFNLGSVILSVICVVFVAEAAAPVAAIGNSQFFWWLFMIIAFLLPYGLISSELGTTYQGEGGLYDWIHQAFPGTRWGARASWFSYDQGGRLSRIKDGTGQWNFVYNALGQRSFWYFISKKMK